MCCVVLCFMHSCTQQNATRIVDRTTSVPIWNHTDRGSQQPQQPADNMVTPTLTCLLPLLLLTALTAYAYSYSYCLLVL